MLRLVWVPGGRAVVGGGWLLGQRARGLLVGKVRRPRLLLLLLMLGGGVHLLLLLLLLRVLLRVGGWVGGLGLGRRRLLLLVGRNGDRGRVATGRLEPRRVLGMVWGGVVVLVVVVVLLLLLLPRRQGGQGFVAGEKLFFGDVFAQNLDVEEGRVAFPEHGQDGGGVLPVPGRAAVLVIKVPGRLVRPSRPVRDGDPDARGGQFPPEAPAVGRVDVGDGVQELHAFPGAKHVAHRLDDVVGRPASREKGGT